MTLRILSLCAEMEPWCRTGGLGDVAAALPRAIADGDRAHEILFATALPLYGAIGAKLERSRLRRVDGPSVEATVGGETFSGTWYALDDGVAWPVYFLECKDLFDGPSLYEMPESSSYTLAQRFGFFCLAAQLSADRLCQGETDILHLHDWHVAPVARLNQAARMEVQRPKTVLTIHNLAFQGWFPVSEAPELTDLGQDEHFSFLKQGVVYADQMTTVSPRYAVEIQTQTFGCGLEQLLCQRGVVGILNGIDDASWDPSTDAALDAPFSVESLAGRQLCRQRLLADANWSDDPKAPLLGVVSRLAHQKGLDWVAELVPKLDELNARLVVLGTGEAELEQELLHLSQAFPQRLHAIIRFDDAVARRIYAGTDAFLIPSRFEPCGLTQLYAMRYGSVPIVNPVGGLRDTVFDGDDPRAQTGYHMQEESTEGLYDALQRACSTYRESPQTWAEIQLNGLRFNSRWQNSGLAYLALYRDLLNR